MTGNYSLFKKMGGKFEFTREVPSPIGPSIKFENRRKSFETKTKRKKLEKNEYELEKLNKNYESPKHIEIKIDTR